MKIGIVVIALALSLAASAQDAAPAKLTFEEAVQIGLKRNVLLNQQKNQLEANQAQKLNAYGNFLPNASINGRFTRQSGNQQNATSGDLENITTDNFNASVNANLTIFNGLRNVNTLLQGNNQVMAQSYLVKRSNQDVVSVVANQYLTVLLDQELLRIAEENLNAQKTLRDQFQGFFDVGQRAITDVYNQDAIMKAAQVTAIRARNTLQNDRSLLAQTLQLDPSQTFEVVLPQFESAFVSYKNLSLDSLINIAVQNRDDLKQLDYQVQANKYFMKSNFSLYAPTLTAFASYGSFYYSLIPENFNSQFKTLNPSLSYGANIAIPIFNRFQSRSQRVASRVTYENSVLNKENLEKTVKIDVQRALNNLINAEEAYQSSLSQFQAGELALRTQRESYELGISAQVALAQATQTYVLGAASKAQAEVTLIFQRILMEYALGTLKPDDYLNRK